MEIDEKPSNDQHEASKLPEWEAISYKVIHAHGMHLRMRSTKKEKITCDSRIACAVLRNYRGRGYKNQSKFEVAEYIGWIEEIVKLEYCNHCCIILVCSWVRAYPEQGGTFVIHDRYGFILENFQNSMSLGTESFAFPGQSQ